MRIKRIGCGFENLLAVLFEVVELATVQRPREHAQNAQHEHGRQRDEQVQDVHAALEGSQRASRSELRTTTSELVAMPRPAAHGGSQPISASGTQAAL